MNLFRNEGVYEVIMVKNRKYIIVIAVMVSAIGLLHAKNVIQEYLDDNPYVLFNSLPAYEEYSGEIYRLDGALYSEMKMIVDRDTMDGYLFIEYYSADEITKITFNSNFRFIGSRTIVVSDQDLLLEELTFDSYQTIYDDFKNRYIVQYLSNETVISEETVKPDWDAVSFEALRFLLQAVLINEGSDFKTSVFMIEDGGTYTIKFTLKETDNLKKMEPKYDYPPTFEQVSDQDEDVYVFEINPQDITGKFTGIKFYAAYERDYPHKFIAYWGGSKNYTEFVYMYED